MEGPDSPTTNSTVSWRRKGVVALGVVLGLVVTVLVVWAVFIGPVAVWRVLAHGTTTVWDHLEYPGRTIGPTEPSPWPAPAALRDLSSLETGAGPLDEILEGTRSLSFLIVRDGDVVLEWYAPGHAPEQAVMLFSVTKSIVSLLVGAALEDGLIGSLTDPVAGYLPEMDLDGATTLRIVDLLTMDSSLDYVEDDNPFGRHVEFNYTPSLAKATLALRQRSRPDDGFRYKSGDFAILTLILDRVLGDGSVTDYLQWRILDPLGVEDPGVWSTDRVDGLERGWCCLAISARDLARIGQLMLDGGRWGNLQVVPAEYVAVSLSPAYTASRWPVEYRDSPLANYGYGWWQTHRGAWLALGKDGQYLYLDPARGVVVVRQGETVGGLSWVGLIEEVLATLP